MPRRIVEKIVHFGAFKRELDKVVDLMRSDIPGSVVIRGGIGTGKKTLIQEASKIVGEDHARVIWICPNQCPDDQIAMRTICRELDMKNNSTVEEIMRGICDYCENNDQKLVFVLVDFEEFCRKRQSLLYNLMNVIQGEFVRPKRAVNVLLIGLTVSISWADDLEKRVRSRLNAKCIELDYPYESEEDFIEFASQLLDGYKIEGEFCNMLNYMYLVRRAPIHELKNYLARICSKGENGELVVNFDEEAYKDDIHFSCSVLARERLKSLAKPELELLKVAVIYCGKEEKNRFTLNELDCWMINCGRKRPFEVDNEFTKHTLSRLVAQGLVKPVNPNNWSTALDCVFYPTFTPQSFKEIIKLDPSLSSQRIDLFWNVSNKSSKS